MEGLLSDEQKKAREEGLKAGKKRREVLASLKLTDEQKEKVEAVAKEVGTLVREETGEDPGRAQRRAKGEAPGAARTSAGSVSAIGWPIGSRTSRT